MVDVAERPDYRVGPILHRHPQHVVHIVVLVEQLAVTRVPGLPGGSHALDLAKRSLVHRGHQDGLGVPVVRRDAGHHVRDDQPLEVLLVAQRVLDRQDATPGAAEQEEVVGIEPESLAHLL
jgi:hypothetical protein